MTEYLIELLKDKSKLATLSRGYGRKTRGFMLADDKATARIIGDEPFQLYRKFGKDVHVAVGEERALAIPTILNECPEIDLILLDDAFQHRAVKPQLSILVSDYSKPFFEDHLLPMGRLREARVGARRADIIVITKADAATEADQNKIAHKVKQIAGDKPVFFSGIHYGDPVPIQCQAAPGQHVILVSAIANNSHFEKAASRQFTIHHHFRFPDHHTYTPEDLARIQSVASQHKVDSIITTEKDMVKLVSAELQPYLARNNFFYVPVKAVILQNGPAFDALVQEMIQKKTNKL